MFELATITLSALFGGVAAYFGIVWQTKYGAKKHIHEQIHDRRATLYPEAWQITGRLPRRPTRQLPFEELAKISMELEAWYYKEGGIYRRNAASILHRSGSVSRNSETTSRTTCSIRPTV